LTRDDFAFLSQHIGDMENLETLEHFEASIELFRHLFRIEPELIAYDLHPDYLSTRYALSGTQDPTPTVGIQHHQAHIASCLVDSGWDPEAGPVIGVAWDGTGYGLDGHIWGGEFFVGDYARRGFRRVAHLEYVPMPGGEAAIRNPWRLALGYHLALTGELPRLRHRESAITDEEMRIVGQQVERAMQGRGQGLALNTPLTSAAGRLFDAVAALVGIRQRVTYEAQAAIELEMLATTWAGHSRPGNVPAYPFEIEKADDRMVIRLRALLEALGEDVAASVNPGQIGYRFHHTMAHLIVEVCRQIAVQTGLDTVALSGGCFQNRLLLALAVPQLEDGGFRVLLHGQVPCNDGGVSLGQVALAHFAQIG
jgi:hydrogenase maturation protein HypF